jgi:hypothetical protein
LSDLEVPNWLLHCCSSSWVNSNIKSSGNLKIFLRFNFNPLAFSHKLYSLQSCPLLHPPQLSRSKLR